MSTWKVAHTCMGLVLHRCQLQCWCIADLGMPQACAAAFSPSHRLCAVGHILASFQGCSCVRQSLPAAPEHKRQKFLKVSFVPHFCSENGNISWKIQHMKVMLFSKSTIYLLLILPFFFFFLAEDPLGNTFFKGHFWHPGLLPASIHLLLPPAHTICRIPLLLPSWCKDKTFGVRSLCRTH